MSKLITHLLQEKIYKQISPRHHNSLFLTELPVIQKKICIFLEDLSIAFLAPNAFQRSQFRKVESAPTYLHSWVDDSWFFRESNMLCLGSVRVVDSSQQVIFGDSKSFKRNLKARMTKKGTLWKPIWGLMPLQSFLTVCLSWTSSCSFPWPPANFSNLKQLWARCKTLAERKLFYTVEQGASLCSRLMWCDRVLAGLGAQPPWGNVISSLDSSIG